MKLTLCVWYDVLDDNVRYNKEQATHCVDAVIEW